MAKNEPRAIVWLSCPQCARPLIPTEMVITKNGARVIIRIMNLEIYRTRIICPGCGKKRLFISREYDSDNLANIDND